MTGNIRHSLGLLVAAAFAALVGLVLFAIDVPQAHDIGAFVILAGLVLALVGLWRIAAELVRPQQQQD